MARKGIERFILVGHSMGGASATLVAAANPRRVRALVLEDPAWFDEKKPHWRRSAKMMLSLELKRIRVDPRALGARHRHQKWTEENSLRWLDAKRQASEEALQWFDCDSLDWAKAVSVIECPTLLFMCGGDDAIVRTPQTERVRSLNSNVRIEHIEAAGHNIRREAEDEFINIMSAWLSQTRLLSG